MNTSVYWIHHPDHTDLLTQGYIGVSNNFEKRLVSHKHRTANQHLKRAIQKYGWDNLLKRQLLISTEEYCLMMEEKLRPSDSIGWNIVKGGGKPPTIKWNLGKKHSEELKKKISITKTGVKQSPEQAKKSAESILKVGFATRFKKGMTSVNKNKPRRKELVEAHRKFMTGRKITEEHKANISKSLMGRIVTPETREKIRLGNLGKERPMKNKKFPTVECPHCHVVGGINCMQRWHMDNCKHKENQ